jgi:hypothetical protein
MTIKSIVIPAVLAVVLAVAGWGFWTLGHTEQRLAEAHKQLAVLQYADAGSESDDAAAEPPMVQRLIAQGGLSDADAKDAHQLHATADYWQARYAALEPKRDAGGAITEKDPGVLLFAANAAFRAGQGETDRNLALRRLDGVVKTYAEVLKNSGSHADAAYNYEYAIRVRDTLAKARQLPPQKPAARALAEKVESDLPSGPTVHGKPGGPPAAASMAQFKIVIPKRGEERKDDPQAGKGGAKIRKG